MRKNKGEEQYSFRADLWDWLWNKPQDWLNQWRFRHNPAPGSDFELVQDKHGHTYWLKQGSDGVGEIVAWHLYYRGEQVGEANGLKLEGEEEFSIGNLEINPDHQGRGLGMMLLKRIEHMAQQQGASIICGRVVAKDLGAFPGLLAWYRKQEYSVLAMESEPQRGGTHDVANIRKAVLA